MTPAKLKKLRDLNARLEKAFAPHSRDWGNEFPKLRAEIERQEKGHRKMGARFTGGAAQYHPLSHAVEYFVAKVILAGVGGFPPKSWNEVTGLRDDFVMGAAICETLMLKGWTPSKEDCDFLETIDYTTDCVKRAP